MKTLYWLTTLMFVGVAATAQHTLQSPEEFLGYQLGDRFTLHYRAIDYYKHVAETMPNVKLVEYGKTYEHRPLVYAVVTATENFKNLEQIRLDNLRRAGVEPGTPSTKVAIIWLSYNVHGNEANSLEASMRTLFELVDPANAKSQQWLKNTVVILDPCLNPDGRDRYANFFNQYGNILPNPDVDAMEHREPWPDGRPNHYLFDLNRDWAWLTQTESQQRIKAYNQWLPHIHVDFHEQYIDNPYYFAPAAEPLHEVITPWQREFQMAVGKNNAKYFDEQGWLYFSKEAFDLFYPGYGDSYPMFNGAIGMTYEQAGHSRGGLSVTTKEGDLLTLKDRLAHHHTSGMSTIEITAQHANKIVDEFEKYFRESINNPATPYKAYVIKSDNNADKLTKLAALMDSHGIKFGYAGVTKSLRGFDYTTQAQQNFTLSANDLVISVYQPKSRFITTLFEPQSKLSDSLTYDITAWNLMYAYGLKGYAVNERINFSGSYQPKVTHDTTIEPKPYAYIFNYKSLKDVEFLAALLKRGIKVRAATKAFKTSNESFSPGTLIITQRNNETVVDFNNVVKEEAKKYGRKIYTATTGFVDAGNDFGSASVVYLKAPRVAMVVGEQTSSLSAGEVWHYFEQQIKYPVTQLGTEYFKSVDLKKFDVLVLPSGHYRMLDEAQLEKLGEWVSNGGRLILLAHALTSFTDQKGFALKQYATEEAKKEAEKKDKELKEKEGLVRYEEAERKYISGYMAGAIYKTSLDTSHPLAFGLGDTYYSLRENNLHYTFLENGWNVAVIKGRAKPVQGFAGYKINRKLDNTLVFGVEDKGQGNIVYFVENPLFRGFWENGLVAFSNALFMVGGR
jgi:hypothetical protein